jgi:hypothetical protein
MYIIKKNLAIMMIHIMIIRRYFIAEEIEKRLLLSRKDKTCITEILQLDDAISEIQITFKSGNILILR